MCGMVKTNRNLWSAFLALILHFVGLSVLSSWWPRGSSTDAPQKAFRVETLSRDLLSKTKWRTLGVKKGGRAFQMPLSRLGKPRPTPKTLPSALSPKIQTSPNESYNKAQMQKEILRELAPGLEEIQILNNSDFHVRFEPPEGVSESELNSAEKMYYSFQKRTFINYAHSFLRSYQGLILKRPTLLRPLRENTHILSGRIIFDAKGNIVSVKIFKSSPNNDVHQLFEDTLIQMGRLPNPPKALLEKNGQFVIYYHMKIN